MKFTSVITQKKASKKHVSAVVFVLQYFAKYFFFMLRFRHSWHKKGQILGKPSFSANLKTFCEFPPGQAERRILALLALINIGGEAVLHRKVKKIL